MIETQTLIFVLIGFGIFFGSLFILDIYFLIKSSKKKEEDKNVVALEFSQKFFLELERIIAQEIKRTFSEINQRMIEELLTVYKKEVAEFSQSAERKMIGFEEVTKKEVLKIANISSETQDLILKEIKKKNEELMKNLDEKINQIQKIAFQSLDQKISQTEKIIDEYKKERLKEIDRKVYQLIGEVAKKIIGKTIDISTHEELVFQALEKAKKEIL
jgi:hypothetical protein